MFKAKQESPMSNFVGGETIIAQGVKVEGDFHSNGDVIIDGEVAGTVQTAKSLRIGETARIKADVHAASAVIAGEVQGNLIVDQMLELLSTSLVKGDITVGRISVAAGAQINGRITMGGGAEHDVATDEDQDDDE